MPWDSKYINFGLVKIEDKKVKVYSNQGSYNTISVGEEIVSAIWAGGELNVQLKKGKVRRYSSLSSYITI